MDLLFITANVLAAAAGIALVVLVLCRLARWARSRPKGAYVLGALIVPLGGIGNVSDPEYKMVNEARELKKREEDDSGDPPEPSGDDATER
jgi:hypothetical protein